MNKVRACGCKGIRSCLICEAEFNITNVNYIDELQSLEPWSYCIDCKCFYPGWNTDEVKAKHPQHGNIDGLQIPGIYVEANFLKQTEADKLVEDIDGLEWCSSQSGRRKQNFGPKTNFKKRRLHNGDFKGFPDFSEFIQQRFETVDLLRNFITIEQCALEYDPLKGASIDPHIDDCWIWGERVLTVNCLGNSVLTLRLYCDAVSPNNLVNIDKYNLNSVSTYKESLITPIWNSNDLQLFKNIILRIPMPQLSLMVLFGPLRYQFEHCVLREDVKERRVCLAYREFTPPYLKDKGLNQVEVKQILKNSKCFYNCRQIQNEDSHL